jgi:hypothetical protein
MQKIERARMERVGFGYAERTSKSGHEIAVRMIPAMACAAFLAMTVLSGCSSQASPEAGNAIQPESTSAQGGTGIPAASTSPVSAGGGEAGKAPCYLTAAQAGEIVARPVSYLPNFAGPGTCAYQSADTRYLINIGPDPLQELYPTPVCDASTQEPQTYGVTELPNGCIIWEVPVVASYIVSIYVNSSRGMIRLQVTTPPGTDMTQFKERADAAASVIASYL